jgi:uncharacterized protein (DUF433 family)
MATVHTPYISAAISNELLEGDTIKLGDPRYGLIWANPERVSGAPCFFGTRVPVQTLFDYIEAGDSIDVFLEGFPPIKREHVLAVLELAKRGVIDGNIRP